MLDKRLYYFRSEQARSSRLERRNPRNKNRTNISRLQRQFISENWMKIAHAASLAVSLDIRQLSLCDGHEGMCNFTQTVFIIEKTVPAHEKIDPESYLSCHIAISSAVKEICADLRSRFSSELCDGTVRYGDAKTVDRSI